MKSSNDTAIHELTLDRTEGDIAVLLDADDEKIELSAKLLPREVKDGEVLIITVATEKAETKRRETKAKEILNEILSNSD
ncbi:hypothetical protein COT78_04245 [Candidatus Berkelbacteria bacterium CG10_big_fil_rev_8_21_14_0_10_43_13]|uniref:DUF3006 domain-containing protein n=1 Tax=Candidatus Berkelbacteria bacterium CG10_big_fil_rev_8_21_14_0_10_43_13 TaxID=1974514 RepID=A0A2H0W7N0_9BACT|nr:MAG: hypothetical protein COT78_04245 [Candidatus Berkelbacteria bacterium CG10_big_fil_rev_8_21_14_0_10_43_13]